MYILLKAVEDMWDKPVDDIDMKKIGNPTQIDELENQIGYWKEGKLTSSKYTNVETDPLFIFRWVIFLCLQNSKA